MDDDEFKLEKTEIMTGIREITKNIKAVPQKEVEWKALQQRDKI